MTCVRLANAQTLDCHVQFIPCAVSAWACCALLALVHLTDPGFSWRSTAGLESRG